jgi:hypothetical protein
MPSYRRSTREKTGNRAGLRCVGRTRACAAADRSCQQPAVAGPDAAVQRACPHAGVWATWLRCPAAAATQRRTRDKWQLRREGLRARWDGTASRRHRQQAVAALWALVGERRAPGIAVAGGTAAGAVVRHNGGSRWKRKRASMEARGYREEGGDWGELIQMPASRGGWESRRWTCSAGAGEQRGRDLGQTGCTGCGSFGAGPAR